MSLEDLLNAVPADSDEATLARSVDFARLPRHVAIIMDGNGRWARQRNRPRVEGHRAGIASVRDTVETAARLGLEALTLYAFSVENWKRPETEVQTLMGLLKHYLRLELNSLLKNNIRFGVLGRVEDLPKDVQSELARAMEKSKDQHGACSSTSPSTTAGAPRSWTPPGGSSRTSPRGRSMPLPSTRQRLRRGSIPRDCPIPDLLIRTSGEMRISNFLLWQIAYAEIWVTDVYWPEFRCRHLLQAILDYQKRERRYGGIGGA